MRLYDFNYLTKKQRGKTLIAYLQSSRKSSFVLLPTNIKDSTYKFLEYHGIDKVDVTLATQHSKMDPSFSIKYDGHPTSTSNCKRAKLISKYLLNHKIVPLNNLKVNNKICN